MSGGGKLERKQNYFVKLIKLLEGYEQILIVECDNVGSSHMQAIRKALRKHSTVLLMGKNTLIRKAVKGHIEKNPLVQALLPHLCGNIGLVFTKGDMTEVRKVIDDNKVAAPAKVGAIAPCDVVVPKGNTGMEPTQTAFLQALNIASKITRGQIEIINDVHLIHKGDKVGQSEATLLQKLDIKPFQYGLSVKTVYDRGSVYDQAVLDMTDADIIAKFRAGLNNIAAISLAIGVPTVASVPHTIIRGYKNLVAISLATDITFNRVKELKELLADPTKLAAASAAAKSAAPVAEKKEEKAAAAAAAVADEPEEEMGVGDLFG